MLINGDMIEFPNSIPGFADLNEMVDYLQYTVSFN